MAIRDLLAGLLPSINTIRARREKIDAEIAQLVAERAALLSPPLPLDDYIAWQLELIDAAAERGLRDFGAVLHDRNRAWSHHRAPRDAATIGDEPASNYWPASATPISLFNPVDRSPHVGETTVRQDAVCAILGDVLKDGLERVLREKLSPIWPREVGLPREQRIERADAMTAQIAALRTDRAQLDQAVREAAAEFERNATS